MNRHSFLAPVIIIALLLCCQVMAGDLASRGDAWQEAFDTGDAERLANIYGRDGRLLPPNGEPVMGREAIQKFWANSIASGIHIQTRLEDMTEVGHLGYRRGSFDVTDGEGNNIDDGKYLEIWEKRDGHWWFEIDIWNSNRPAAASLP